MENDKIYERKYRKYKEKYLKLKQQGGGFTTDALILTKFDTIKELLYPNQSYEQLAKENNTTVKCIEFESKIRNETGSMSHLLLQSLEQFVPFNKTVNICGETQVKKMGSEMGKIVTPQLAEIGSIAKQQMTGMVQQTTKTLSSSLQQGMTTGMSALQQGMQQKIDTGMSKIQRKIQPPQRGGEDNFVHIEFINEIAQRLFGKTVKLDDVGRIITDRKYNILIRYKQQLIGKSKVTIFRLE